jgi:hypothetical protein
MLIKLNRNNKETSAKLFEQISEYMAQEDLETGEEMDAMVSRIAQQQKVNSYRY